MNAKSLPASEVHLFYRFVRAAAPAGGGSVPNVPLPLPPAVSRLSWDADGTPRLDPAKRNVACATPLLEPLAGRGPAPRVLLLSPPGRRATLNGAPAPRLAILAQGDEFHFDDSCAFTVAIYYRPWCGPVPEHCLGLACPICTIPLAPGDRCLICSCGAPFHAAAEATAEGVLDCVRMAAVCSRCQQPLRLEAGYDNFSLHAHE